MSENAKRTYLKPVHTSPETAHVTEDYPYGFRLRCKRRAWIETTKNGQRFCTQTTNPKRAVETWNAPKKSTYSECLVMYLDENGHVHTDGVSVHATVEQFAAFRERAKDALDEAGLKRVETAEKVTAAINAHWAKRQAAIDAQPHKTAGAIVDDMIAKLG